MGEWVNRHPLGIRVVGLGLALLVFAVAVAIPATAALSHGSAARASLERARANLEQQNFADTLNAANDAGRELTALRRSLNALSVLQAWPVAGTQIRAVTVIADVGITLTEALRDGTKAMEQILGPLQQSKGTVSLATLTPADKRAILERIAASGSQLESVRTHIAAAGARFKAMPSRGLVAPIEATVAPLREQIPFLEDTVTQLIPATQILPAVAGFPNPKTYLFLMQNNSELRPTGGFIGTYGILKVSAGEITSFTTSDVYTLDKPVKDTLRIDPPLPLKLYNDTTQWFFRDSNWSPDFPTAAQKALEFYRLENGPQKNIDGVIAVTPTVISSLLKISGDITVDKITFTPENLVEKLQPKADRKELIGEMSKILLSRILALPQKRWQELIAALSEALEEKHMLLYSKDHDLEQRIVNQNWGGAMQTFAVDGFAVVDANLAGLKTDSVIDRAISYDLTVTDASATATLKITYAHKGKFTQTTTRYRTYTRVYVPRGAALVSSEGVLRNDKLRGAKPGTVDVGEEFGKTVFGAFTSVEPGEAGTLSFTYTLPSEIASAVRNGRYELLVQKQPGTRGHTLTGTLAFPRNVQYATGVDGVTQNGHTGVILKSTLTSDRHLTVVF